MVTLTSIQPHQTKFDALVEQANGLYSEWSTSTERADELRAQLGKVLRQAKDDMPDGVTWPAIVKARFNFSAEWANQLIREVDGRTTAEATREGARKRVQQHRSKPVLRNTENTPSKTKSKELRQARTNRALEAKLKEERARRERSNERCKWLQHEFATSQQVVAGLSSQIERLRDAPAVTRFKGLWDNASADERAEIRAVVNG